MSLRLLHLAILLVSDCPLIASEEAPARGGKVQWARLQTDYEYWSRHTEHEHMVLDYIRDNTTLDLEPQWAAADVRDLESLILYPFLYAEGIQPIEDRKSKANLREFLLRGGFLLIDSCINHEVNPDPDHFLQLQIKRFAEILPEAKIARIPVDHPIYRCLFKIEELPHSFMGGVYDPKWAAHPLYAVQQDERVVAIISLAGLKCGWSFNKERPTHREESMRMLLNIYTYALMN